MTTTLGGVSFDSDMFWEDEFNDNRVSASVTKTIGGGAVVQEFAKAEKGRFITLSSQASHGTQYKSTISSLIALAQVANATYTLVIGAVTKTVRFRNEIDGGAVQFQPFTEIDGEVAVTIPYKGTLYLMVV